MIKHNYSKSELFLMEFIVVILFFSLSAAICISAFVKANNISEESKKLNHAVILAQSTAEKIKASGSTGENYSGTYDNRYYLKVESTVEDEMLTADIAVYEKSDRKTEICRLEVKKYLPDEVQNEKN